MLAEACNQAAFEESFSMLQFSEWWVCIVCVCPHQVSWTPTLPCVTTRAAMLRSTSTRCTCTQQRRRCSHAGTTTDHQQGQQQQQQQSRGNSTGSGRSVRIIYVCLHWSAGHLAWFSAALAVNSRRQPTQTQYRIISAVHGATICLCINSNQRACASAWYID